MERKGPLKFVLCLNKRLIWKQLQASWDKSSQCSILPILCQWKIIRDLLLKSSLFGVAIIIQKFSYRKQLLFTWKQNGLLEALRIMEDLVLFNKILHLKVGSKLYVYSHLFPHIDRPQGNITRNKPHLILKQNKNTLTEWY